RAPTSTNTGNYTQYGGAPPQRASAVGTPTRTQQASGNNFRPRVNRVDGDNRVYDTLQVNGHAMRTLINTGANRSVITQASAEKARLSITPPVKDSYIYLADKVSAHRA
ncbi:hypothetical protein SARC_12375, partial [Sphaeroforma arctica JP610]